MGLTVETHVESPVCENLPRPEDVLMAWLVRQPAGADLIGAVDTELDRLRRYAGRHPGPARLAELFSELRRSIAQPAHPRALQ